MLRRTMLAGLVSLTWAGACSSGGSKSSGTGTGTGSGQRDLVTTLAKEAQCETFLKLLREAGYIDTLRGAGPFTLLAPNDAALEELRMQGTLPRLQKLPSGDGLRRLLDHHIVAGLVPDSAMSRAKELRALDGRNLEVQRMGQRVEIEGAKILRANVAASNGIIHVLDKAMGSLAEYQ